VEDRDGNCGGERYLHVAVFVLAQLRIEVVVVECQRMIENTGS
jgi:hypothetical protein